MGLEEIISLMKTIFINHSERWSVSKKGKESYRKVRNSSLEPRMFDIVRESTMTLTCHNCKKPGHKTKHCKQLTEKLDESSDAGNGKMK